MECGAFESFFQPILGEGRSVLLPSSPAPLLSAFLASSFPYPATRIRLSESGVGPETCCHGPGEGAGAGRTGGAMSVRPIQRVGKSNPTVEDAGVRLRRALGVGN